ncbi:hypothetical protein J7K18_05325 [bacterium]|nr:hypothetical protein [bacterium]
MSQKTGRVTLFLVLAAISVAYLRNYLVTPHAATRMRFISDVLSNQSDPPYRYRLLVPFLEDNIANLCPSSSIRSQHLFGFTATFSPVFFLIYYLFHQLLRLYLTENSSLLGVLLLAVVIPVSVTGYLMEGDFLTLLLFILGFWCFHKEKDWAIPLIILLGTFNREQMLFLLVFYILYKASINQLRDKKTVLTVVASLLAWGAVFLGLRFILGFMPSRFTVLHHLKSNLNWDNFSNKITAIWLPVVFGFVVLAIASWRKTNRFFKLAFVSLGIYLLLFLLKGLLWELAKFLPAYLVLIPMALETITGEHTGKT